MSTSIPAIEYAAAKQGHTDAVLGQCLTVLQEQFQRAHLLIAQQTLLGKKYQLWMKMCTAAHEYNPDSPMSNEVKSWYDGTADRVFATFLPVEIQ